MLNRRTTLFKLSLVYSLILICALVGTGFFSLYSAEEALDSELSNQLVIIAKLAAREVSTVIKSKRLNPLILSYSESAPYVNLLKKIKIIKDISRAENIIIIGSDETIIMDSSGIFPPGAGYPFLKMDQMEVDKVWLGESAASELYRGSDGKYYKSGYSPVKDSKGNVIVVVRVEASVEFFEIMEKVRERIVLMGLVILLVTGLISFWISKSIINPLNLLVEAFEKVAGFHKVNIGGNSEFSYLGEKFNDMVDRIEEKDTLLKLRYKEEWQRAESIKGYSDYILEGIPTGVICIGMNKEIKILNNAAQDILSIAGEHIGQECSSVLRSFPRIVKRLVASLESGRKEGFEEISVDIHEGEARWLGISSSGIYGGEKELLGSIAIFSDLTELRRLQTHVSIQERLVAIGELSTGIAHEIRNPLGAIQGFVELLGRESENQKTRKLTDDITFEIGNLNKRISEFLEFARSPNYDFRKSDLQNIIQMAIAFSIPQEDGKYSVSLEMEETLVEFELDSMYMEGAFVNLLKNAKEAMADGGEIRIRLFREDGIVIVDVTDSGNGIKVEDIDKIFDPFYTTKRSGTGLGLAIAHKTIESHGGTLSVEKSNKSGTTFRVRLPV